MTPQGATGSMISIFRKSTQNISNQNNGSSSSENQNHSMNLIRNIQSGLNNTPSRNNNFNQQSISYVKTRFVNNKSNGRYLNIEDGSTD